MLTIDNPATFDWINISLPDCIEGNCWDTHFTLKLFHEFEKHLEGDPRWDLYENLISPVSDQFLEMEYEGNIVDKEALKTIGRELKNHNIRKEDTMYEMEQVPVKYSLTSNKDVANILFLDENGFGLFPPMFTDTDDPKTDKACLEMIMEQIEEELRSRRG